MEEVQSKNSRDINVATITPMHREHPLVGPHLDKKMIECHKKF